MDDLNPSTLLKTKLREGVERLGRFEPLKVWNSPRFAYAHARRID
jgi:hypothetical protein